MQGRLNAFQRSMLQWDDLHPYNAVHVVRVPGILDVQCLRTAISTTLHRMGVAGLQLDPKAGAYEFVDSPAAEVKVIASPAVEACLAGAPASGPASGDWSDLGALAPGLQEQVEAELNAAFPADKCFTPFRFFVAAADGSFSLGLAYFHPICDAESIVFLLKDIVETYQGTGKAANSVERYPSGQGNRFWRHPGILAWKLASLPGSVLKMRRTCRPNYRDPSDLSNQFTFFRLGPQVLRGMIQSARSWNVTLNDLFLALLMKAVSRVAPKRTQADRRRMLSLGCVVNTRRDLGLEGRRTFGLFLGSFIVHHEAPPEADLAQLARDIGQQTRAIKQRRLYLGAALELSLGRRLVSLFSEQRRKKLYQKHYPLWGGITNMNLNPMWPQPRGAGAVDYFRAVCTGPITPLVLSITTIGEAVNMGVTYRPTVFGIADIERIKAGFADSLGRPQEQ